MELYKQKTAPIREKRLNAIGAYYGDAATILQEFRDGLVNQRIRTFSHDLNSDIQYALQLINTFKDIAVVVHGPAGCAAARLYFDLAYDDTVKWAITNLNERDSIMGSDAKLREAIRQVYKSYAPRIIFVVTTPVVAINNDDVESVVDELRDEFNIKILPVYTDGFRSKVGATGYDVVLHAILKHLLPAVDYGRAKGNFINLLSVSENFDDLKEVVRLLNETGLLVNILPRFSGPENFTKATDALFSVSVNPDEASYLGEALENTYEIPYLRSEIPLGILHTSNWLTKIGEATNRVEETAEIVERETALLRQYLENNKFAGKKVFVHLPTSYAFAIIDLLGDIGFEIVAVKVPYIDVQHVDQLERFVSNNFDIPLLVGEGQIMEEIQIIQHAAPDVYLSAKSDNISAIRAGVPCVDIDSISILGYRGIYHLVDAIAKKLSNPSFSRYLSGGNAEVYTSSWLQKKANWFIKQEVK